MLKLWNKEKKCKNGKHCNNTILQLAKTKFQKQVAIELLELKNDMKWIKYLLGTVLLVVVVNVLTKVV